MSGVSTARPYDSTGPDDPSSQHPITRCSDNGVSTGAGSTGLRYQRVRLRGFHADNASVERHGAQDGRELGADPWRCWEIAPASDELKRKLISTWNLVPDSHAFHGVASGNHIYCRYDGLSESYSGDADSYRAVGIDATKNIMVVYFYNG